MLLDPQHYVVVVHFHYSDKAHVVSVQLIPAVVHRYLPVVMSVPPVLLVLRILRKLLLHALLEPGAREDPRQERVLLVPLDFRVPILQYHRYLVHQGRTVRSGPQIVQLVLPVQVVRIQPYHRLDVRVVPMR